MDDFQSKLNSLSLKYKIALGAVTALIISPIIFLIVKGIIGAAIAATVGIVAINTIPVFTQKMANWRLKQIIDEARRRPIEDAANIIMKKETQFNESKKKVAASAAARDSFTEQCRQFAKQYPTRAQEFFGRIDQMNRAVERHKQALQKTKVALDTSKEVLTEMRAYYDMTKALDAANAAINVGQVDMTEQMRLDTAWKSVMDGMNTAFAELEVADAIDPMSAANQPPQQVPQLENQPAASLFATFNKTNQRV